MKTIRLLNLTCSILVSSTFAVLSGAVAAQSALETDKMAGECANYAILAQKEQAAEAALQMASNRARAERFMEQAFEEVKRINARGEWTEDRQRVFAFNGTGTCRELGIRVSDY
jgi:hypothetical protein